MEFYINLSTHFLHLRIDMFILLGFAYLRHKGKITVENTKKFLKEKL